MTLCESGALLIASGKRGWIRIAMSRRANMKEMECALRWHANGRAGRRASECGACAVEIAAPSSISKETRDRARVVGRLSLARGLQHAIQCIKQKWLGNGLARIQPTKRNANVVPAAMCDQQKAPGSLPPRACIMWVALGSRRQRDAVAAAVTLNCQAIGQLGHRFRNLAF